MLRYSYKKHSRGHESLVKMIKNARLVAIANVSKHAGGERVKK